MAELQALDRRVGISASDDTASNWGTEAQADVKLVDHTSFDYSESNARTMYLEENKTAPNGWKDGSRTTDLTFNGRCTYDGAWIDFLLAISAAATSSGTEQTAGEGDYLHGAYSLTANTNPRFFSVAWFGDSDSILAAKSFMPTSITISGSVNQPLEYSVSGIATRVIDSTETSSSELNAITRQNYEECLFGGNSGTYCRISNDFGSALSSSHDREVTGFSYSLTRPAVRQHGLNGANSSDTLIPRFAGKYEQSLSITLASNNNDSLNFYDLYENSTTLRASIATTGRAIASGVSRSIIFNFPALEWTGQGIAGAGIEEGSLSEPTLQFAPSTRRAGAGTGFTIADSHFQVINNQSGAY